MTGGDQQDEPSAADGAPAHDPADGSPPGDPAGPPAPAQPTTSPLPPRPAVDRRRVALIGTGLLAITLAGVLALQVLGGSDGGAFGAGTRRDFLYVFEGLGDGEWEQRDTTQAPYIIRTGEDTYESYDPLPAPDDPNCCPSKYSQILWRAELDGDHGLIVQDVPLTIPADELPDDPHEPRF